MERTEILNKLWHLENLLIADEHHNKLKKENQDCTNRYNQLYSELLQKQQQLNDVVTNSHKNVTYKKILYIISGLSLINPAFYALRHFELFDFIFSIVSVILFWYSISVYKNEKGSFAFTFPRIIVIGILFIISVWTILQNFVYFLNPFYLTIAYKFEILKFIQLIISVLTTIVLTFLLIIIQKKFFSYSLDSIKSLELRIVYLQNELNKTLEKWQKVESDFNATTSYSNEIHSFINGWLSEKYSKLGIVRQLYSYIYNYEADTIVKAIEEYNKDKRHREEMEKTDTLSSKIDKQNEMIDNLDQKLSDIDKNTKETASNSKKTEKGIRGLRNDLWGRKRY